MIQTQNREITNYRRHNCTRDHRSDRTFAQCVWPRAHWVIGDGPYATLAFCRVLTIELHETREHAERMLDVIAGSGCGGACKGERGHRLVFLSRPAPRKAKRQAKCATSGAGLPGHGASRNRYAGRCAACGHDVAPGAGYVVRGVVTNAWQTYC